MNYKKEVIKISAFNFIFNSVLTFIGWKMVNITYEIFLLYYLYGFSIIYIHMMGHKQMFNHWFKQHTINHHIKLYPPKNFDSEEYISGIPWYKNGNVIYYVLATLLGSIIIGKTYSMKIFLYLYSIIIMERENILHTEIHKSNSIFKNYTWYIVLKDLHRVHHRGKMNKNYGFSDMFHDYFNNSLEFPE